MNVFLSLFMPVWYKAQPTWVITDQFIFVISSKKKKKKRERYDCTKEQVKSKENLFEGLTVRQVFRIRQIDGIFPIYHIWCEQPISYSFFLLFVFFFLSCIDDDEKENKKKCCHLLWNPDRWFVFWMNRLSTRSPVRCLSFLHTLIFSWKIEKKLCNIKNGIHKHFSCITRERERDRKIKRKLGLRCDYKVKKGKRQ